MTPPADSRRDYGRAGRIGVGTPQANPTVEAEFRRLLPVDVEFVSTRLVSRQADARARLVEYLERLDDSLASYGGMGLDLYCFACTGSSYLLGHAAERERVDRAANRFGYPVITATQAIEERLQQLQARRIALIAPYPEWLLSAAVAWWRGRGFEVASQRQVAIARPGDTSSIYELTSADALAAVRAAGDLRVDALLLSGTGMPTLPALAAIQAVAGVPVLSSNLALAGQAVARLGLTLSPLPTPAD
ncbi:MAG: hypothetical protein EDM71_09005 [Proteobacteria bacterium]|nr:MAG: hypothetical protein EDM71_09005 [Pseudomonadota bacterium]MBC6945848.1 hypothetical protein [Gammaproteobacteria bacterium]MCE7895437.1 hypothetical protein [Gammaproteobacteria bacterium PRO8]MCQ3933792.1 hypothetical protein [Gammaproteobacteria bacterium]MDL1879834.1 hypothetical protein [Gammaproteobacteria bacterium PRO2]